MAFNCSNLVCFKSDLGVNFSISNEMLLACVGELPGMLSLGISDLKNLGLIFCMACAFSGKYLRNKSC